VRVEYLCLYLFKFIKINIKKAPAIDLGDMPAFSSIVAENTHNIHRIVDIDLTSYYRTRAYSYCLLSPTEIRERTYSQSSLSRTEIVEFI
jgi:hypothetical protein